MTRAFQGKTALITGGSRGIGRAIAERLARDGATVAITYNTGKAAADETVAAITAAGGSAFALQADLQAADGIPALLARFDGELAGRGIEPTLDVLVNNAGNSGFGGVTNGTLETFDGILGVHARAPFFLVQAALPRLPQGARIINISSGFATRPSPVASIYSMAKAAINTLTHALAIELGPRGITVNAVAPGWTRTDMNAAVRENAEMSRGIEADTALGRFGEPSDIASVVAFLASAEGGWVTGQVLEASGGYRL